MKGYQNPNRDWFGDIVDFFNDAYRSGVDWYNDKVSRVQRYFRNEPMQDEQDFDIYNLLDTLGVPRNMKDELKDYMEKYGLDWSDLNINKVMSIFGSQQQRAYRTGINFVSKNLHKLYR